MLSDFLTNNKVGVIKTKDYYPQSFPYNPSARYPEYVFSTLSSEKNFVYEAIRNLLFSLGLDKKNFNSKHWNPLGEFIIPGNKVLLKPNLVHERKKNVDSTCLTTHPSLIRAIIDYVAIALKGKGEIIIGDAPIPDTDFEKVKRENNLDKLVDFYRKNNIEIQIIDFRKEKTWKPYYLAAVLKREKLLGDVLGFIPINLGKESELLDFKKDYRKFRVTKWSKKEMLKHHNDKKNEYLIANTFLQADTVINIPKLKTHRKAGMTGALKNMIGINGSKDWLPHHRAGAKEEGGDEYLKKDWRKKVRTLLMEKQNASSNKIFIVFLSFLRFLLSLIKYVFPYQDSYLEGSWWGNDTVARTIVDINKIAFYANKKGAFKETPQRKIFTIVDAIVAGEKEGPLEPSPKHCGLIIGGVNSVAIDIVCSKIMGFDFRKIPTLGYALQSKKYKLFEGDLEKIDITFGQKNIDIKELEKNIALKFTPAAGWKGHIES